MLYYDHNCGDIDDDDKNDIDILVLSMLFQTWQHENSCNLHFSTSAYDAKKQVACKHLVDVVSKRRQTYNDSIEFMTMSNNTCSDKGLLLPIFHEEESWQKGVRAALYFIAMIWCFFGIAIVADTFICGIEHITSKTRIIKVASRDKQEGEKEVEVKVWNDTVANLSLLAFGTSAPEILLSMIETLKNEFKSGELGPGTIVGSAAFNLFCITAVCIMCVPDGESRRLKNMRVFGVTAFTGIFAYFWLIIVLLWTSPKEVELWEAIVTFLLFPILIMVAYSADKGFCCVRNKTASEVEIGVGE